ncbi:MAG: MerR family transcriptional regulator [Clostridiales bacterium]|nr:MerR family transcriptional regulator [Clostridiales bacterium]
MTIKQVSQKLGVSSDTLRYYERIGAVPPVNRTHGGIRDYSESDISWAELACCMRSAGLPVEAIVEYRKLYEQGSDTIAARLLLLKTQMESLKAQRLKIDETIKRLNYKISKYEIAVKTGELKWD